jgi:putative transposase
MPIARLAEFRGPSLVFVTTTVRDWLPVFSMEHAAKALLDQLRETAETRGVSVAGYVVMPSHIHVMIGLTDYGQLALFMQAFKGLSARRVRQLDLAGMEARLWDGGSFSLWRRRFDDLVICSEVQFKRKLEYIHNNPVRAGLVQSAVSWRHSSARDWLGGDAGPITVVRNFVWLK